LEGKPEDAGESLWKMALRQRLTMEAFPFTQQEWRQVCGVTSSLANATLQDDDILRTSLLVELATALEELRQRRGNHPVLLETEADFCDDPMVQRDMYLAAIQLAETNSLPTLTIRISLAGALLESFDDPKQATSELMACESELAAETDEWVVREWCKLVKECSERESSRIQAGGRRT
jgi:hypothetical protein